MRDLDPARGLGLECDQEAEDKDEDVDDNEEHDFQDTTCQNPAESHDLISCNKAQEGFDTYKARPIAWAEVKGEVVATGAVAQGEFWLSIHTITHLIRCHPQRQTLTVVEVVAALVAAIRSVWGAGDYSWR
ncbi:hypothetical protein BY996DRAFT_6427552 [Phakopsora pachyrhizi]|nr:hypothetical protein BY996DRAFT_6427552 [Phakopsora pachyrhizi]